MPGPPPPGEEGFRPLEPDEPCDVSRRKPSERPGRGPIAHLQRTRAEVVVHARGLASVGLQASADIPVEEAEAVPADPAAAAELGAEVQRLRCQLGEVNERADARDA